MSSFQFCTKGICYSNKLTPKHSQITGISKGNYVFSKKKKIDCLEQNLEKLSQPVLVCD